MQIVARIICQGASVAEVTYRSGFHVEVLVAKSFQQENIHFPLTHSENVALVGTWEQALDYYFNEACFECKDHLLPGEIPRVDSAREHKALFREAVNALRKDLEPFGYKIEVEYV